METPATIPPNAYKLTPGELENPYLVLQSLFDFMNIHQLEELLSEWFKITVTGSYCSSEYNRKDRQNLFLLYEQLYKLLQASNLILNERKTTKHDKES